MVFRVSSRTQPESLERERKRDRERQTETETETEREENRERENITESHPASFWPCTPRYMHLCTDANLRSCIFYILCLIFTSLMSVIMQVV